MPDFQVPSTWKVHASDTDRVVFQLPGHTVAAPCLVIVDRRTPTFQGQGRWTVPWYRTRVIKGHTDSDGNPLPTRTVVELTVRWPQQASEQEVEDALSIIGDIASDAGYQDDVFEQYLPRLVSSD